jgi:hypothetical protein
MARLRTPSAPAASFRPALEMLEDRVVLSPLGDFFNGLDPTKLLIVPIAEAQVGIVNLDVASFNNTPRNPSTLIQLAADAGRLQAYANQVSAMVDVFTTAADGAIGTNAFTNLLTPIEVKALSATENAAKAVASQLQTAANDAISSAYAAMFFFASGAAKGTLPAIPTGAPAANPTPSPPPTPAGTVGESIDKAPATWPSDAKIGPGESVTVTNPTNALLTVTVSYQASDGSSSSNTDVCTNSTITVATGAPVSAPGVTGYWTVSVTGQPDQTNTTTFQ